MSDVTIEPIRPDLPFGSRVGGVDLEVLEDPLVRGRLVEAFDERGLLVFEGVDPTPQVQVAISTVFGPLKDHPSSATPRVGGEGMVGVIEIRHEPGEGGVVSFGGRELSQWLPWHFDHCYNDQLNRAGVLRSVTIPPDGGMTGFVDGIALYDAVDPQVRARVEGRTVRYAMDVILANLRYGRPEGFVEVRQSAQAGDVMAEYADRPFALHPAVWTRPTGEKVLHVSPWMAKGVVGLDDAEADALLTEVCDEIVGAPPTPSAPPGWPPPARVIGDTGGVLPRVRAWDPRHSRCMHRTTIAGDYGLGRFEAVAPA